MLVFLFSNYYIQYIFFPKFRILVIYEALVAVAFKNALTEIHNFNFHLEPLWSKSVEHHYYYIEKKLVSNYQIIW